ncbi:MAG TPA: substrate-binding domain-containing protein, partial [Candidatus Ozemobacteraceae bacterium]|nr:substrate-binding domain-containing protein [Candidatus Ozemobacteraceae bacterium]
GEKLYAHCEEVFQVLEKIVDDIANAGNPRKGAIKVGVLESVLMYWLPKILGEYFQKHPGVTIAFEKAETTTIESGVIDEKFHLGIISRPAFSRKLDEVELGSFPHKLVVSNAFTDDIETLASRLPLYLLGTWQEQALTSGTTLFARIPDVQRLNPINCAGLVRQIVANGLGMAVLPSYIVGPDLRVIEEFPQMRMRLHLIRRKSRRPAPIADQFAAFIEQSARS